MLRFLRGILAVQADTVCRRCPERRRRSDPEVILSSVKADRDLHCLLLDPERVFVHVEADANLHSVDRPHDPLHVQNHWTERP